MMRAAMEIPPDLIITISDMRRVHCVRGIKGWWAAYPDLPPFREFLKNGMLATDLAATGDGLALRVIRLTLESRANG